MRRRREIEDPDNTWDMQLVAAIREGNTAAADALLLKGASIAHYAFDSESGLFFSPFHCAAIRGDVETMAWVCAHGGNPNAPFRSSMDSATGSAGPILHRCVRMDAIDLLRKLCVNRTAIDESFSLDQEDPDTQQTAFSLALSLRKIDAARVLLRYGASFQEHERINAFFNSVSRAAHVGDTAALEDLLNVGESPLQRTIPCGLPLLHVAAAEPASLEVLFEHGVDVNTAVDTAGDNILTFLIRQNIFSQPGKGDGGVLEYFISRGADVNAGDVTLQMTPLMHAIFAYQPEIIKKLLVDFRADPNVRDVMGQTAIHYAVTAARRGALELLCTSSLVEATDVNAADVHGLTALHRACDRRCVQAVAFLLTLSAVDVNARDNDGRTPLIVAARQGYEDIVQLLVKRRGEETMKDIAPAKRGFSRRGGGGDPTPALGRLNVDATDARGMSALRYAAEFHHSKIVLALLSGVTTTPRDVTSVDLMMNVACSGDVESLQSVISHGADVMARDSNDETALHVACTTGNRATAELLLDRAAQVNAQSSVTLRTPLHIVAATGDAALARLLVFQGAVLTVRDMQQRTPLHVAATNGFVEVAEALAEAATSSQAAAIQDVDGRYPLHAACEANSPAIVELCIRLDPTKVREVDKWMHTPLQAAARCGATAALQVLVKELRIQQCCATELKRRDQEGRTAWLLAADSAFGDTAHFLHLLATRAAN